MRYATAAAAVALALAGLPTVTQAQQIAVTAEQVNLRAGPDTGYPVVAVMPPGTHVTVLGCLGDYRWCDVTYGPDRGWVFAANLQYIQPNNTAVPLPSIGAAVGIGVLAFVLSDYWNDHYRSRPWYRDRREWDQRYYGGRPRHDGRPQYRNERDRDRDRDRSQPAPSSPRVLRNDPNSGWDSRYPDAPRPDKP